MLKNYFKIAWRNLVKNKAYSFINIMGLATGITIALLIGLWVWDEISFNSYHKNYKRTAQVLINQTNNGETYTNSTVATPMGDALNTKYKDAFSYVSLASWPGGHLLTTGEKKLLHSGMWVQPDFVRMFDMKMLSGSADALKDPSSLLITASFAKSLFDNTDATGKIVRLDNEIEMKIGGVYEDLPHNTSFYGTGMLLPWQNKANHFNSITEWKNHTGQLFVRLADNSSFDEVNARIKNLPTPFIKDWKEEALLQPMSEVHLYSEFENGKAAGGAIKFVWLFAAIGIFVLLLACINFMNLSTAKSEKRAREVGIRKAVGSLRSQLIIQFLAESSLVAFLALLIALVLTQLTLPFFNELSGKQISLPWSNPLFWILSLSFTLFTGIVSGSYPAFYLSSFRPIKVLKGVFNAGRFALVPRRVLVVFQFTISIVLIIGTIVVFKQIQYAKNRPAGYARQGLITLPAYSPAMKTHADVIKTSLLQTNVVESLAESSQSMAHFRNNNSLDWPGKDPGYIIFFRNVTIAPEFGKTIGWTIKQGRDFSRDLALDSSGIIINEAAAKAIGFKDPIGQQLTFDKEQYSIVGVVNDMITQSPYGPPEPSIFVRKGYTGALTIRLKPAVSMAAALDKIKTVIKKYNPDAPFEYSFVDEQYGLKFSNETKVGNLVSLFAALAIFISCLGLFGLASFVAEQRTREIGVRKVLGASVANLWRLLSKEFMILVMISFIIAVPLAYYFMHDWLNQYSYRTGISWKTFAVAGIGTLLITLITISFQTIKAAIANPVKNLRSE